jgi:hypothetical protein
VTRTPTPLGAPAIAVLAAALLLTGCVRGGPKPRARPTPTGSRSAIPTPDVCTVASPEKVFTATGHTVEKSAGSGHVCTYTLSGGIRVFAQYDVGPIAGVLSSLETSLKVNSKPLSGVGRYAYGFSTVTAGIPSANVIAANSTTGLVANVGMAGPGSAVALAEPIAAMMVKAL